MMNFHPYFIASTAFAEGYICSYSTPESYQYCPSFSINSILYESIYTNISIPYRRKTWGGVQIW